MRMTSMVFDVRDIRCSRSRYSYHVTAPYISGGGSFAFPGKEFAGFLVQIIPCTLYAPQFLPCPVPAPLSHASLPCPTTAGEQPTPVSSCSQVGASRVASISEGIDVHQHDHYHDHRRNGLRAAMVSGWLPFRDMLVLQMASLNTCVDCREAKPVRVNVGKRTPSRVWSNIVPRWTGNSSANDEGSRSGNRRSSGGGGGADRVCRIPRPNIVAIVWNRATPSPALLYELPSELVRMTFGSNFNQPVIDIDWPEGLREITFGAKFSQSLAGARWPATLKQMTFGSAFDQPLQDITWPEGLVDVSFGTGFRQALEGNRARWPRTLERVTLADYREDLTDLMWPSKILMLTISGSFDRSLDAVTFPDSLQELTLSCRFNRSIDDVVFPPGLKHLTFGDIFNQPLGSDGTFTFPTALEELTFGVLFDQPIERVAWSNKLTHLTLGHRFNQPIQAVVWPSSLKSVRINSDHFNQPVQEAAWPEGLTELYFGDAFNHDVSSMFWPPGLTRIVLGDRFNKPVQGTQWPAALEELEFGHNYNQPVKGVSWPGSLRRVKFGSRFKQHLSGTEWPLSLETLDVGDCNMAWAHGPKAGYDNWSSGLTIVSRANFDEFGWQKKYRREIPTGWNIQTVNFGRK